MKYYIKHNDYFIQETLNGFVRLLYVDNATEYDSLQEIENFINTINLNLAHIEVVHFEPKAQRYYNGQWVNTEELELCSACETLHYKKDLLKGVVCKETGLEYFCEHCYNDQDFIIENQPLDELEVE